MSIRIKHQVVKNNVASYFSLSILAKKFPMRKYRSSRYSPSKVGNACESLGIYYQCKYIYTNNRYLSFCCAEGSLASFS